VGAIHKDVSNVANTPSKRKIIPDRTIVVFIIIFLLGSLGILFYVINVPKAQKGFTEYYILGQEGKAVDYPTDLKMGQQSSVTIGIVNHEGKKVSYRIEVLANNLKIETGEPIELADKQTWEGSVNFTLMTLGNNQKIEFWLYKNDEGEPSLGPLYLWVNVSL
jgi:uncharacterized membrane protein